MTTRDQPVQIIDPPGVAPATSYSHVSRAGNFVHVAGQIAKDETGSWVGIGNAGARSFGDGGGFGGADGVFGDG